MAASKKLAKLRPDVAETAFRVIQEATGERPKTLAPEERTEKHPEAVKRGRKGGKKGAEVRVKKLTKERRSDIATLAAVARWKRSER